MLPFRLAGATFSATPCINKRSKIQNGRCENPANFLHPFPGWRTNENQPPRPREKLRSTSLTSVQSLQRHWLRARSTSRVGRKEDSSVEVRVSRGGVATRVGCDGAQRRRRDAVVATRTRPSARVHRRRAARRIGAGEDEPGAPGSKYYQGVGGGVCEAGWRGHAYNVPDSTSRGRWTAIDPPPTPGCSRGKTLWKLLACLQPSWTRSRSRVSACNELDGTVWSNVQDDDWAPLYGCMGAFVNIRCVWVFL